MKKREAGFQIKFKAWLQANPPVTSSCYELKWAPGLTFSVFEWVKKQPHQLTGLLSASTLGEICYHKISDASYDKKPFDCFVMANAQAFLVIWFDTEKAAIMVPAKIIHKILLTSGKKTATFDELVAEGGCVIRP